MDKEEIVKEIVEVVWKELETHRCADGSICTDCGMCVEKNLPVTNAVIEAGASRISAVPGTVPASREIAKLIDHTFLKPEGTEKDIRRLCEEAKQYGFASVCVNPYWVPLCAEMLAGTDVKVCTVIGFPLGATTTETKAFEAKKALEDGATEFDMVINIGALKSDRFEDVYRDIKAVVDAVAPHTVKVIIETALLTDEEKVEACAIAKEAGAHFVKTSTGFAKGGATVEDVRLMKAVVGEEMEVKASGGVRDYKTALEMVKAGATRIGASAGVAIVQGKTGTESY